MAAPADTKKADQQEMGGQDDGQSDNLDMMDL